MEQEGKGRSARTAGSGPPRGFGLAERATDWNLFEDLSAPGRPAARSPARSQAFAALNPGRVQPVSPAMPAQGFGRPAVEAI